jgi:hypothetical protein
VTGLTIEVSDPAAAARRWAAVLEISAADGGHTIWVIGGVRFAGGEG